MPRSKISAILYLLLVFVSGIVLGGFANHYYTAKASVLPASAPRNMEEFRTRYMSEMRQRVGVSAEQEAAITKILDETKKKFDELHKVERPRRDQLQQEQVDAIRAVLTKDQDTAYEAWRAERQKTYRQQKARPAQSQQ